ncbi:MAG: MiaB/RimO family radical SAM methylthiotransferase, partial [Candidatus Binatia bacterium]
SGRMTRVGFQKKEDFRFVTLLPDESESALKAFVTIMKGCDNFCSFCIVPAVRGREICRDPDDILREIDALVDLGVREVTLLGQNVNSYGVGRHEKASGMISFDRLLERIANRTGVERIRFTTSHPKDLSEALIAQFSANKKLAKNFHLPVQSGSDAVLEKMYRGYTVEEYIAKLERLRRACPDLAVSTDVIVGFCSESEADFSATLELLKSSRFDSIFSFVYSPRPKTTAGLYFADDVPEAVKRDRLARVQALQEKITLERNKSWEGKILEVLVEGPSRQGMTYSGRSSQNHAVHFSGTEADVGRTLPIFIRHAGPNSLRGEKYVGGQSQFDTHEGHGTHH